MPGVPLHEIERDRVDSLASYAVLDTTPERSYDQLTSLAARICRTPTAAVNLVDARRQWSKSSYGAPRGEVPREGSFCSDVAASARSLIVPDAVKHPRYRNNPHVLSGDVRAYAGVPLIGRDGLALGALCVVDRRPRRFSSSQMDDLNGLASQVVALLEQHRHDHMAGLLDGTLATVTRDGERLRAALDDGELVPHYQPVVDLKTGQTVALEALLRWEHPQLGTLPPAAFLAALEAGALVVPVGRAVLDAALRTLSELQRQGAAPRDGVAVNVASGQLARPGLARDVLAALQRHEVTADRLHLEVTESTALPDQALAERELHTLAQAGVHIVIDDFGVGWSNLSRVLDLPVDSLKLDCSIAAQVVCNPRAAAMTDAIIALAQRLGLRVTAEGIETEAVREHLTHAGCDQGQGYLFHAPVPRAALPRLLDPTRGVRTWSPLHLAG